MEDKDAFKNLIVQNNSLIMEIKDFQEELMNLKISETSLKSEKKAADTQIQKADFQIQKADIQIKELKAANEQLKLNRDKHQIEQKRLKNRLQHLEKANFVLQNSVSFRMGQAFVHAVTKPGRNTILLPYRIGRILFSYLFKGLRTK